MASLSQPTDWPRATSADGGAPGTPNWFRYGLVIRVGSWPFRNPCSRKGFARFSSFGLPAGCANAATNTSASPTIRNQHITPAVLRSKRSRSSRPKPKRSIRDTPASSFKALSPTSCRTVLLTTRRMCLDGSTSWWRASMGSSGRKRKPKPSALSAQSPTQQ